MSEKTDIPATDEELVEMHKKARKRRRRRRVITVVVVVVVVVIALAAAIVVLRSRVDEAVGTSENEVTSAVVTTGSITTTVSGSGTLSDETVEDITAPSVLTISEFYVEEGDVVEEGDLIATVTNASLRSAMSDTQDAIDALDEQISEAAGDTVSDTVTASVSGRVKEICVTDGEEVEAAMYRSGALLILSLDGSMAVDLETDQLHDGEEVTVTTGGTDYDGTVESAAGGRATILLTDDGPLSGDEATVKTTGGSEVGSGTLYIHSPMAITGYTGTVSSVEVSENDEVSAGTTLLTLTDTETSASYDALLVERRDLEEQLDTLVRIYKEGGICAPCGGTVASIETAASGTSSSSLSSYADYYGTDGTSSVDTDAVTVATVSVDENMVITISVDETDILSLSEGQEAYVTIDSIGDDTYEGTVTYVGTTASSGSGVTSYSAEITIPKEDEMLSGMSASVKITIEGVEDALVIPVEALHQTSSAAYVYTKYDADTGEFSGMTEVIAGLSNGSLVEITSGLSEGDVVWYTPSGDDWYSMFFGGDFDMEDFDFGSFDIDSFDIDSFDMDSLPGGLGDETPGGMGGGIGGGAGGMGGAAGGGTGGMGGGLGGR